VLNRDIPHISLGLANQEGLQQIQIVLRLFNLVKLCIHQRQTEQTWQMGRILLIKLDLQCTYLDSCLKQVHCLLPFYFLLFIQQTVLLVITDHQRRIAG